MEKEKANNRILKAIGVISLSVFCVFLGFCLCMSCTPLKELDRQMYTLSSHFYYGFEELRLLDKVSEMDADQVKSLEFEVDRLCYVLDLYEFDFPPVFGEKLSPEETRTIRLFLGHVLDRLGDIYPGEELKAEDKQYFTMTWSIIDRALSMPDPFEWLSNKIIEENLI